MQSEREPGEWIWRVSERREPFWDWKKQLLEDGLFGTDWPKFIQLKGAEMEFSDRTERCVERKKRRRFTYLTFYLIWTWAHNINGLYIYYDVCQN